MDLQKEAEETTFDQNLTKEILDTFKFFKFAPLEKNEERMDEETAVELTRMYFTVSNLPQYAEEEEETEDSE